MHFCTGHLSGSTVLASETPFLCHFFLVTLETQLGSVNGLITLSSSTHHSDSPVSRTIGNKSPNSVSFHPKISKWNPIVTCFDPQTDGNADSDLWCVQSLRTTGRDCPSGGSMTVPLMVYFRGQHRTNACHSQVTCPRHYKASVHLCMTAKEVLYMLHLRGIIGYSIP